MKKISSLLTFFILVGALCSCDDKINSMENLNSAPTFEFFRSSSINWEVPKDVIIDSAKVWSSTNNSSYPAILRITDVNNNISKINITSNDSESSFFVNDNTYFNNFEVTNNQKFNLAFRSSKPGMFDYLVIAKDDFGKISEMRFRINFKNNRGPIANLRLVLINSANRNYSLDASKSIDQDQAIGGMVVNYEFTIDNIIINTSEPKINHIFSVGKHEVKLRVKDSDEVWSDYITVNLNVI